MTDAQRLARLSRNARLTATVIDMIADDETPPVKELHREPSREPYREPQREREPSRPSPPPPAKTFRRQVRPPVAPPQPAPQSATYPFITRPVGQPADTTRSMRTVLTYLQESPDAVSGEDGSSNDATNPEWAKSSANLHQPPVRPARWFQPWAGGIAFVVVATSVIAIQQYLQSGAPVLTTTDRSRAVVSSLIGDTMMRPAAPTATPAPAPAELSRTEPSRQVAETASSGGYTPRIQVTMVSRPCSAPRPSMVRQSRPVSGKRPPKSPARKAPVRWRR